MFQKSHCQTFMVIGKTTVIITVWTWCWPSFHDILLCAERYWTSDLGQPASFFYFGFCIRTDMLLYQTTGQVSVFLNAEFNFTVSFFE
jgi:hypothetical protein